MLRFLVFLGGLRGGAFVAKASVGDPYIHRPALLSLPSMLIRRFKCLPEPVNVQRVVLLKRLLRQDFAEEVGQLVSGLLRWSLF